MCLSGCLLGPISHALWQDFWLTFVYRFLSFSLCCFYKKIGSVSVYIWIYNHGGKSSLQASPLPIIFFPRASQALQFVPIQTNLTLLHSETLTYKHGLSQTATRTWKLHVKNELFYFWNMDFLEIKRCTVWICTQCLHAVSAVTAVANDACNTVQWLWIVSPAQQQCQLERFLCAEKKENTNEE